MYVFELSKSMLLFSTSKSEKRLLRKNIQVFKVVMRDVTVHGNPFLNDSVFFNLYLSGGRFINSTLLIWLPTM